ncbi:hypothetical protein BDQ17DRAFT_970551 [Cyathus striatus]|nr:hypothetical protein BDQ17DRAFT_970551 [Cyathus striatus]
MSTAKYTRLPTLEKFDDSYDDLPGLPLSPSSPSSSTSPISRTSSIDHTEDIESRPRPRRRRQSPLPAFDSDPRFRIVKPSPWARAALIAFMLFTFYLAFRMRKSLWLILLESDGVHETEDPESWYM